MQKLVTMTRNRVLQLSLFSKLIWVHRNASLYWPVSMQYVCKIYVNLLPLVINSCLVYLVADLMPSFIRHGPTIPRRTEVPLPDMGPSAYPVAPSREPAVSRNKSFLRAPVQRPPHEVARRESHRMSAPPYLPRSLGDLPHEYGGSSQSFLTDVSPMSENGDAARYYYPSEPYYDNHQHQQQRQPRRVPDRFPEDFRYYEHNEHNFQRLPRQHTPPAPSRPPSGKHEKCFYWLRYFSVTGKETKGCDSWEKKRVQNVTKIRKCILELHTWFWKVHGSQSSTLKGLKLSFIAFCLQILSYESGAVVFTDEWNHTSRSFQICLFGRMLRSKWLLLWNDKVWWMGFGPYIGHFEGNASMTLSVSKEHFNFSFFFFKFSLNIFILLLHIVNTSMV